MANKCDLLGDDRENLERLKAHVTAQGYEFFEMSAVAHQGTRELMQSTAGRLANLPPVITFEPDYIPPEAGAVTAEDVIIHQYGDVWTVDGAWIDRLVSSTNFSDYESRIFFDRSMREAGIFQRMEDMGVKDGDTVCLGDLEFEYQH